MGVYEGVQYKTRRVKVCGGMTLLERFPEELLKYDWVRSEDKKAAENPGTCTTESVKCDF